MWGPWRNGWLSGALGLWLWEQAGAAGQISECPALKALMEEIKD